MARTTSRSHALAHSMPRNAGFALLRPASKPELDAARILTMSATLAINLIAMGLLMMPLAMPPPAPLDAPTIRHPARDIPRDQPVVVEIVKKAVTPAPVTQPIKLQTLAPPHNQATSIAVIAAATGSEQVVDNVAMEDTGATTDLGNAVSTAPAVMQLEYLSAPAPKYPRNALMQQIQGTVLLQVLVGIDGRPLEVTVSKTSGNRELDEAARSQILRRWTFRAAMRNGQAVQALGLVPVAFSLRD